MEIPSKRLSNGFPIPVIGLGTYGMGGNVAADPTNDDDRDIRAIKQALRLGVVHLDTAELYARGKAEELVGRAIIGFQREKLFLASKVRRDHLTYDDIQRAIEGSFRRLRVNYLDVYYLHRYPGDDELPNCLKAMDALVRQGLIRGIGISNFNLRHMQKALALAQNPIVATQVHYNLQFREPEITGVLKFCQENDVMLVAWRPLNQAIYNKTGVNLTKSGIRIVDLLCSKYSKSPAQVAINWLISQSSVVTIFKTSNRRNLHENLGSLGWRLSDDEISRLRSEFPDQKSISDNQPLK